MKRKIIAALMSALPLICVSGIYAGDGFESVRCGSDVVKALIGRKSANEPVVKIEARHKEIQLKHLGADIISDDERLSLVSWQICGEEYATLEQDDVVKDAIKFPKHSKDTPEFDGSCQVNGKDVPWYAVGVLKNQEGVAMLQALVAWKIDQKQKKFVPLQVEGLRCSRDEIITADGGR
ncbi:MAG TPA: hypothetical protein VLK27_04570 [Chthoniobacterales bacterium]|nr:hypothetical protein [Chthoniobacterales bacterium]